MSNYIYDPNKSYTEYLQQKQYVDSINRNVELQINRQTRQLITSSEKAIREYGAQLSTGFHQLHQDNEIISYQLKEIHSDITDLSSKFEWGFSNMLTALGGINDSLDTLIEINVTGIQTRAYNHFAIARDAFRRRLFQDSLDELDKAINGVPGISTGYPLEWRFHKLKGIIRLGFIGCNPSFVDLSEAKKAFLNAARYSEVDQPHEAARSLLLAARASYLGGAFHIALKYLEESLMLNPNLSESMFLAAKIYSAQNELTTSYRYLRDAIKLDDFYMLRAAADGDFQKHEDSFILFVKELTDEYYTPIEAELKSIKSDFAGYLNGLDILSQEVIGPRTFLENKYASQRLEELKKKLDIYRSYHSSFSELFRNKHNGEIANEYDRIHDICNGYCRSTTRKIDVDGMFNKINALFNEETLSSMESAAQLTNNLAKEVSAEMKTAKNDISKALDVSKDKSKKDTADTASVAVSGIVFVVAAIVSAIPLLGWIGAKFFNWFDSLFGHYDQGQHDFATKCGNAFLYAIGISAAIIAFVWIMGFLRKASLEGTIQSKRNISHTIREDIDNLILRINNILR